jgi:hypothetical protein
MKYRQAQMKAQRGGKGRYELRKRQLEMKNGQDNTPAAPVVPISNDAPTATTISARVKKNRAKREKRAKQKSKNNTTPLENEETTTIQVPGTGTDYDTIRLHLDDNDMTNVATGGAASVVDALEK